MLEFVLVIPTRNEERFIKEILLQSDKSLGSFLSNYKVVLVDASSSDNTVKIANKIARKNNNIEIVSGRRRDAKGDDIKYVFFNYNSKYYGFIDADLANCIKYLPEAVKNLDKGYDVVIGSRYLDARSARRALVRLIPSLAYNWLMNTIFNEKITDWQCGFKMFNKKAVDRLRRYSEEREGQWDSEALLICKYAGLRIHQMPVNGKEIRSRGVAREMRLTMRFTYRHLKLLSRMIYTFKIKGIRYS